MENAVDALKIAFALIVFAIALVVAFTAFSNARRTSEIVLSMSDKTTYQEQVNINTGDENRTVGMETILPILRRYVNDNENYGVELQDKTGKVIKLTLNDGTTTEAIFDLLEDQKLNRTPTQIKNRLEKCLEALSKTYMGNSFIETYSETVYRGQVVTLVDGEEVETINTDTKVKITYKLK